MQGAFNELAANLLAGVRLALFLPVGREHYAVGRDQLWVVLGAAFASVFVAQWLLSTPERTGGGFPATYAVASLVLLLLSGLAVASVQRQRQVLVPALVVLASPLPTLSLALMALSPWVAPAETALSGEDPASPAVVASFAVGVWHIAVNFRALRLIFAQSALPTLAMTAMMLLIGLPLPVMKSVYYYDTEAARARDAALLSPETLPATATAVPPANFAGYSLEDLYYMQQPKLWGLMEALQRQRPGTVDLYYLGFAASSGADVYRREVQAARQLMDERFDTAGRSLLLVNDHDTLHELPIASASGLAWALGWLTSIMDVEEDVLFLHLAAEAAEDALTPDLPPLPMDGLTAARLKSMLDGEGYKWRVVVVSACRIGTFAEALADDNTLVLAAAGNGRSAGGCEAGQDFTGFGRAYFDRGLRQERSFLRAFDVAREIADREHGAAGYPQAYAGNAIRARLGALEARLAN